MGQKTWGRWATAAMKKANDLEEKNPEVHKSSKSNKWETAVLDALRESLGITSNSKAEEDKKKKRKTKTEVKEAPKEVEFGWMK